MAQTIPTNAAFSTAYMKPDPDDVGDALWGQKIADNTGFLYYRTQKEFEISAGLQGVFLTSGGAPVFNQVGTTFFIKTTGRGTLSGTCFGSCSSGGTAKAWVNGALIVNFENTGTSFGTAWTVDISGLTDGVKYPISYAAGVTPNGAAMFGMLRSFVGWSSV